MEAMRQRVSSGISGVLAYEGTALQAKARAVLPPEGGEGTIAQRAAKIAAAGGFSEEEGLARALLRYIFHTVILMACLDRLGVFCCCYSRAMKRILEYVEVGFPREGRDRRTLNLSPRSCRPTSWLAPTLNHCHQPICRVTRKTLQRYHHRLGPNIRSRPFQLVQEGIFQVDE